MADGVFNVAKGDVNELTNRVAINDPANATLQVVLLQAAVADNIMEDLADLAAVLAQGGNTEADFTNYIRKPQTDAEVNPPVVDNTNNRKNSDSPDVTWTAAGGTLDNTLAKLLICYDPTGASPDNAIIPLTFHDFVFTTNGSDLIAQIDPIGFFSAT